MPGQGLSVDYGSSAVDVKDITPDTRICLHLHNDCIPGTDLHAPAASLALLKANGRVNAFEGYGPGHAHAHTRAAAVTVRGYPHRESGEAVNVPEKALGLSEANGVAHRAAAVAAKADVQHSAVVDTPQPCIEPVVHHHGIQAAPQRLVRVGHGFLRRDGAAKPRIELARRLPQDETAQFGGMAFAIVAPPAQALGHDADGTGRMDELFDDGNRKDYAFAPGQHAADRNEVGGGGTFGIVLSERGDALPQAGGLEEAHDKVIEKTGSSHMCTLVLKLDIMPEKIRHN